MDMFNFPRRDDFNKSSAEREAESMLIDILGGVLLNSRMPEEKKVEVRIIMTVTRLQDLIRDKVDKLCPANGELGSELYAKQKKALALLENMYGMLNCFDETVTENKTTNKIKE